MATNSHGHMESRHTSVPGQVSRLCFSQPPRAGQGEPWAHASSVTRWGSLGKGRYGGGIQAPLGAESGRNDLVCPRSFPSPFAFQDLQTFPAPLSSKDVKVATMENAHSVEVFLLFRVVTGQNVMRARAPPPPLGMS